MFGDCQVLSSMAAMAGGSSSADALFASPLMQPSHNHAGALAGFMSSTSGMPFHHHHHHFSTNLIPVSASSSS
jgi:hypothetical protein